MTFHPWRALREQAGVSLRWERLPGALGWWCARTATITLHPDQGQAERRCTLTHELIHAERGDVDCDGQVHREAARRLIDVRALGEAIAFHGADLVHVADELWVDVDTLTTRLEHLHPAERGYLKARLERIEAGA